MITTPEALAELCQRLKKRPSFGIDMEFQRERTYFARLYLVQVCDEDDLFLIDPLAVRDLGPLYDLIGDPNIETIVHAGGQDMEIVFQQAGFVPRNIFDTQIGAALMGVGDQPGYATLIDRFFGVRLSKTETVTDWSRRPLSEAQVAYALDDVRYLAELRRKIGRRLEELGRTGWAREEMTHYEDRENYERDPSRLYLRVSRFRSLNRRGLAILRDLAIWREEEAVRRDEPRGRIIADEVLVEIARRTPSKLTDLQALRGLNPGEARRSGDALLATVKSALARPESTWPEVSTPREDTTDLSLVVDILEVLMRARAKEAEIAPSYLGTRSNLAELVDHLRTGGDSAGNSESAPHLLSGWRRELVGNDLIDLAHGRIALRVQPDGVNIGVVTDRA